MTTLRIVGVFNKDLRGLLQVGADYMKPVRCDTRKLQGLVGQQQMISYDAGIGRTLRLDRIAPLTGARLCERAISSERRMRTDARRG